MVKESDSMEKIEKQCNLIVTNLLGTKIDVKMFRFL